MRQAFLELVFYHSVLLIDRHEGGANILLFHHRHQIDRCPSLNFILFVAVMLNDYAAIGLGKSTL